APTVTRFRPADGASGVSTVRPGSDVVAFFSRPMDASTITSSSFTLTSASGVSVPVTVGFDSTDSATATDIPFLRSRSDLAPTTVSHATHTDPAVLTPNPPLAPNASHEVLLKTTIKAADGVPLHYPVGWQFDTEAANTPTGTSVPVHTADPISGTAIDVTFEN